jgi:hypothetical protein
MRRAEKFKRMPSVSAFEEFIHDRIYPVLKKMGLIK